MGNPIPQILQLQGADLRGVKLTDASIDECNFAGADLSGADLMRTSSMGATWFTDANLERANFSGARLDADMSGANLAQAIFASTLLRVECRGARFHGAMFGSTVIASDLTEALGLDAVMHWGQSHLTHTTLLRRSERPWPVKFLRGCGLTDSEIEHVRSIAADPIEFYSCFISYSCRDDAFAVHLHDALQASGIRCWLDKHEVLPGDELQHKINEGIRLWDKVLLLCSEHSLTSPWVRKEIARAIEKETSLERQRSKRTLAIIPLDLDGFLFDSERCDFDWAPDLRTRHVSKFVGWERDRAIFDRQFGRIVMAMRSDESARSRPPTPRL